MSFIGASVNVGLLAVLFKGGHLIGDGLMSPGELTQFAIQSAFVGLGFSGLSTFWGDFTKALEVRQGVHDLLKRRQTDHNTHTYTHTHTYTNTHTTFTNKPPFFDPQAADRVFAAVDVHNDTRLVALAPPRTGAASTEVVWGTSRGELVMTDITFAYPSRPSELVIEKLSLATAQGTHSAAGIPTHVAPPLMTHYNTSASGTHHIIPSTKTDHLPHIIPSTKTDHLPPLLCLALNQGLSRQSLDPPARGRVLCSTSSGDAPSSSPPSVCPLSASISL